MDQSCLLHQVQLAPTPSISSEPWTGQTGKPLNESGKVLGVLRQAGVSLLTILSRGGSIGTRGGKGLGASAVSCL